MKKLIIVGLVLMVVFGCAKTVYVPVQGETKIEIRDSLIRVVDTVTIEVPKERIVEVVPEVDTSYLETKLAYSTAYLDRNKRTIHHTLEHKKTALKTQIDTVFVTQTRTEYKDKVVIEEVEVPVKYVPKIYHISMYFSIAVIAFIIAYIIYKIKGGF